MASVRNQVFIEFIVSGGGTVTTETQDISKAVEELNKTATEAAGAFNAMAQAAEAMAQAGRKAGDAHKWLPARAPSMAGLRQEADRMRQLGEETKGAAAATRDLDAATNNLTKAQSAAERAAALQARRLNNLQDGVSALIVSGTATRYEILNSIRVMENWTRVGGVTGLAIGAVAVAAVGLAQAFKSATKANEELQKATESATDALEKQYRTAALMQIFSSKDIISQVTATENKKKAQDAYNKALGDEVARRQRINELEAKLADLRAKAADPKVIAREQVRALAAMDVPGRGMRGARSSVATEISAVERELRNLRSGSRGTELAIKGVVSAIADLGVAGAKFNIKHSALGQLDAFLDSLFSYKPRRGRRGRRGRAGKTKYPDFDDPTLAIDLEDRGRMLEEIGQTEQGRVAAMVIEQVTLGKQDVFDPLTSSMRELDVVLKNLQGSWGDFTAEMKAAKERYEEMQRAWAAGTPLLKEMDEGMASAAVGAIFYGESFKKAANEVANAIFAEATAKALIEGAYALAALAFGDVAGAELHGAAAASFAATAAAAAAMAGATGGIQRESGGGGGGGGSGGAGRDRAPRDRDMARGGDKQRSTVINVNNFDGHFYATREDALRGLGDAAMRGINMRARGQLRIRQDAIDYNAGQRQFMRRSDGGRR